MQKQDSVLPMVFIGAIVGALVMAVFLALGNPTQNSVADQNNISSSVPPDMTDSIRIDTPTKGQEITSPVLITGQAKGIWFFEASFPVSLVDLSGNIIAQGPAMTSADWMTTDFIPFKAELKFDPGTNTKAVIVLQRDNPSGLAEHNYAVGVPVAFPQRELLTVKVFFANSLFDPDFLIGQVYPVERKIPKTQAVAKAAIQELLKGPSEKEKAEGYFTNINQGVKIQKLTIKNGIARVDFDKQIEFQVGGSARVGAIRRQITETLKQFPAVRNVIISVEGRIDDALQP